MLRASPKGRAKSAGAGLAAGLVLGLTAGLFLRSKKGQEVRKDLEKQTALLQKQILGKLASVEDLTQDSYQDVVDEVLAAYAKGKHALKEELPALRTELRRRWKTVKAFIDKRL